MGEGTVYQEYYEENRLWEIQEAVDDLLSGVPYPRILDAGCGGAEHVRFKPGSHIVGMDISQEQLDRNKAISQSILGDVQTFDLSGYQFDAIICHFLLEHLENPQLALRNLCCGLSPGGIMIIVAPSVLSPSNLVAKFTPLWFHTLVYRYVFGDKRAGMEGRGPFPTPMRLSMSYSRVLCFAADNGFSVEYSRLYQGYQTWWLRRRYRLARVILMVLRALTRWLSLGRADVFLSTYVVVMRR